MSNEDGRQPTDDAFWAHLAEIGGGVCRARILLDEPVQTEDGDLLRRYVITQTLSLELINMLVNTEQRMRPALVSCGVSRQRHRESVSNLAAASDFVWQETRAAARKEGICGRLESVQFYTGRDSGPLLPEAPFPLLGCHTATGAKS